MIDRQAVLNRLDVEHFYGQRVEALRPDGRARLKGLCPLQPEGNPSFTVYRRDKGFKCFSCGASGSPFDLVMRLENCDFPEAMRHVAREVGLDGGEGEPPGRVVRVHVWRDAEVNPVYRKVRLEPKSFFIEVPDGDGGWRPRDRERDGQLPVMLYGDDLLAATTPEDGPVVFTEGEHDADAARDLDLLGVTSGAADSWKPELAQRLRGRQVIIPAHNDSAGEGFAERVASDLRGIAASVKVVRLGLSEEGADLADWVAAGGTKEALLALAEQTSEWEPTEKAAAVQAQAAGEDGPLATPRPKPLAPAALHGPAGDFVRMIEPHTEADPAALLISYFVGFGNVIGRGAYFTADAAKHYTNLYTLVVGNTSRGRKGSSLAQVLVPFSAVDADWALSRVMAGLSSGEGLIWAVRDPIIATERDYDKDPKTHKKTVRYEEVIADQGVSDKRLLIKQTEFGSTLRVMSREGNTLSAMIREAWDSGTLNALTKNSPAKATGAHISIIGHITRDEVLRHLDSTEAVSGFANRFLWICAQRSKLLPEGGRAHELDFAPHVRRLRDAIDFARGVEEMRRDDEARALWFKVYANLTRDLPGLFGAVTARAEAQTMRLAMIYALLDCSPVVRREHLEAALALWRYCEDSVRFVFGDALGDPDADTIIRALRRSEHGLTRTDIANVFARNRPARQIERALGLLLRLGLARCERDTEGEGRPTEWWCAVWPEDQV